MNEEALSWAGAEVTPRANHRPANRQSDVAKPWPKKQSPWGHLQALQPVSHQ